MPVENIMGCLGGLATGLSLVGVCDIFGIFITKLGIDDQGEMFRVTINMCMSVQIGNGWGACSPGRK